MITDHWHKSSYSQGGATNCVECRTADSRVLVRDTQNRSAGHLSFSSREWAAFLGAAAEGEL
ncbi:DUF397 domain-containing protein [Spiractinospora alimapuensis]|uniref:DUF397 domain-containing protein n=1 Tax=Spiractinospora alimapuensis TaxID=2820884 RepID=UPI001F476D14|nr:DUF397 domain-containing protein [Spiractinospora alimapuensis]QVQ52716.1 DUF397 domain-containing protein [Spiractinospora alimapuensis]